MNKNTLLNYYVSYGFLDSQFFKMDQKILTDYSTKKIYKGNTK